MHARDFVYWLQGFFEITEATMAGHGDRATPAPMQLGPAQVDCIKRHLAMVFIHEIDPAMGSIEHQVALTQAHQGGGAAGQPPKSPGPQAPPSHPALEALSQGALLPGVDPFSIRLNC
jgi:hypothetical protein